jgi:hypothetical protein
MLWFRTTDSLVDRIRNKRHEENDWSLIHDRLSYFVSGFSATMVRHKYWLF